MLETIEKNGEFEKYVDMLDEREEKERKDLRRRERERKRLELGDHYDSANDSSELEYDSEFDSEDSDSRISDSVSITHSHSLDGWLSPGHPYREKESKGYD